MPKELPANPSLDFDRKRARRLLRDLRSGDPAALLRLREQHPRFSGTEVEIDPASLSLSDAQLVIAREYGFESWPKLKKHIEALLPMSAKIEALVAAALEGRSDRAIAMLAAEPQLATAAPACLAVLGDDIGLAEVLRAEPDAAVRRHPPLERELLLYLCFSLLHRDSEERRQSFLRCAKLLLEHGADPNAAYDEGGTWAGAMQSCLYGATGHGNFPALARLLLEAGADPNDDECVYHCAQFMYEECLDLLLEFGVDVSRRSPHWTNTPLYFLLGYKQTDQGLETAMRGVLWLLEQGADPNVPCYDIEECPLQLAVRLLHQPHVIEALLKHGADVAYRRADGLSAYALAVRSGYSEAAALLRSYGASDSELEPLDRLVGDCMSGRSDEARALARSIPDLAESLKGREADTLILAAESGNVQALRLLLELGFDANALDRIGATALHNAALRGQPATAALLLKHGARLDLRDTLYEGTPMGWALHGALHMASPGGRYREVVELLLDAGAESTFMDADATWREIKKVRESYPLEELH